MKEAQAFPTEVAPLDDAPDEREVEGRSRLASTHLHGDGEEEGQAEQVDLSFLEAEAEAFSDELLRHSRSCSRSPLRPQGGRLCHTRCLEGDGDNQEDEELCSPLPPPPTPCPCPALPLQVGEDRRGGRQRCPGDWVPPDE